jgi:hypothetical protein
MFVFLLSFVAASERHLYAVTPGYQQSPVVPQSINQLGMEADGRVWLAKAYGQNYETFNKLRGDSSGFVYDPQTQSYVPVVNTVPKEAKGFFRPRSAWWSRVIFLACGVVAFAARIHIVPTVALMRYAIAL